MENIETKEYTQEDANNLYDEAINTAAEKVSHNPKIAELILGQVLKCDSDNLKAMQLMGLVKHRLKKYEEAVEILEIVVEQNPYSAEDLNTLGLAYIELDRPEIAIEHIKKAIDLAPHYTMFKNNLAMAYRKTNADLAIEILEEVLVDNPGNPQMLTNLGTMYGSKKQYDKSTNCFHQALKADPNYAAAHVDLAFDYHLQGEWEKGFDHYEWRLEYFEEMRTLIKLHEKIKKWNGIASLKNKKIIVCSEQGLGDGIQFMRYIPQLAELGACVIVHCPDRIKEIFLKMDGVSKVVAIEKLLSKEATIDADYFCMSLSLPRLLQDYNISGKPYLKPSTDKFRGYLLENHGPSFNIGIVWAGSPIHTNNKKRSIPLKYFRPIHDTEGVSLFSLQFSNKSNSDPEENWTEKLADGCEDMKITSVTNLIKTFDDTATILYGLDLLICCDTSVAHLAGAMGVPTWLAIPYNPDWRWKAEGETTEWYDSVRLFRQKQPGDWEGVFSKMKEELNEIILQNKQ